MKTWLYCLIVTAATVMAVPAFAQKPVSVPVTEVGVDLFTESFAYKVKVKNDASSFNNMTFYIANQGDTDAPNSRIEYWLSSDTVLDEATDTFIHTQSVGKVKSGKVKKRTVGGGLFKKAGITPLTDQYFLAVVDVDNVLPEAREDNNTFSAQILN